MKVTLFALVFMSVVSIGCAPANAEPPTRQERIDASPQWNGKSFQNPVPTPDPSMGEMVSMAWEFFFNKPKGGSIDPPFEAEPVDWATWPSDLPVQFAWLGHTTYLLQVEGKWILTDPMFSQKAGAFGPFSPQRFSTLPLTIDQLPPIDLVLITHDHFDHLDETSIKKLISKTDRFIVPLAVGRYLEDWGVPLEQITELAWWEAARFEGLTLTSAPAQHFSGRSLFNRDQTLWTSYAIKGEQTSLYLSGDTGFHPGLVEIGERLGPFDVTFFEMGAYGEYRGWKEIHCTPEEAVQAHQMVRGKLLVPSHWGTFDLAMFAWHEPIERFVAAADQAGIAYLTPKFGERINPGHVGGKERWWRPFMEPKP
ncbi:MAG: MBL fold metallo-hydrolase [bacterium]|nr:MBL fold metallo-hydrolase [bacterium]